MSLSRWTVTVYDPNEKIHFTLLDEQSGSRSERAVKFVMHIFKNFLLILIFPGFPSLLWNFWNVYMLWSHPSPDFKAGMSNTISIRSPLGQWKFWKMVVTQSPACGFWLPAILGRKIAPRWWQRSACGQDESQPMCPSSHSGGGLEVTEKEWKWTLRVGHHSADACMEGHPGLNHDLCLRSL